MLGNGNKKKKKRKTLHFMFTQSQTGKLSSRQLSNSIGQGLWDNLTLSKCKLGEIWRTSMLATPSKQEE